MTKRKAAAEGGDYKVIRGISWRKANEGKPSDWENVEAGEVRSDLPPEHVQGWLDVGAIEPNEGE